MTVSETRQTAIDENRVLVAEAAFLRAKLREAREALALARNRGIPGADAAETTGLAAG
jgi:hypothetical protein